MANRSCSYFLALVLLVSVMTMLPGGEAQKRCVKELDPNTQCVLYNCRAKCFKQFNGFGSCIEKPYGSEKYVCSCAYNCGSA
ncbi:PREDICTED: putative defensin-like protein 165 [Tarenaya hassleriana]|uniref:putative defensin-like protein 165 n=1 Tax=Tarenaya hassleriana TaxID=28532 RepID=UPI0008FCF703|nr:PREDICTED: putative defensin-like protein 165 [Tarenaya hassleriana]